MTVTLPERFTAKTAPATDCVIWIGAVNSKGYGCFAVDRVSQLAHRVAYEAEHGPIPEGMTLDHLCRGGECSHGHVIRSEADLYVRGHGRGTECRACCRERNARRDRSRG